MEFGLYSFGDYSRRFHQCGRGFTLCLSRPCISASTLPADGPLNTLASCTAIQLLPSCTNYDGQIRHYSLKQEVIQLPQRNSASAAHIEGGALGPPAHSPSAPLATPMRMVESESHNNHTTSSLLERMST